MYFFVSDIESTVVNPPESDHFFSMRVQKGKQYHICDQYGNAREAIIANVDKNNRSVDLSFSSTPIFSQNNRQGVLFHALPDRQYQEKVIEVLAFTHFADLIFVHTDFSSPQLPNFSRLNSINLRSSSQCQTPWAPNISTTIIDFKTALEYNPVILNSSEKALSNDINASENTCFIGPEGGWSDAEQSKFKSKNSMQTYYPGIVYPAWISGLIFDVKNNS